MIYSYGLERFIYLDLIKYLPAGEIRNINDDNKLLELTKKGDFVLFFNYTKKCRIIQSKLNDEGVEMFPEYSVSHAIGNKIFQLISIKSDFQLRHMFCCKTTEGERQEVPYLGNEKTVVKVGDYHQGKNKFLMEPNSFITLKENTIFEEFVEKARSIRIIMIDDRFDNIYIVEQVSDNWIKNDNPISEDVYSFENRYKCGVNEIDKIILDAIWIKKQLNHDYLGIDYVVGEKKIGFLEVNDMIGLPDDIGVREKAKKFFRGLMESREEKC